MAHLWDTNVVSHGEIVMAHIWMSYGTHIDESWHTYGWVMAHI